MASKSNRSKSHARNPRAGAHDPIAALRPHFDETVAKMNTPRAKRAGNLLFAASGEELGEIAKAYARKQRL